jgi:hypothetical protein
MRNNLEAKLTPAGSSQAVAGYSYPEDLARFVRDSWRNLPVPCTKARLNHLAHSIGFA